MDEAEIKQLKSLALAYIGDAVHQLHVREHLIETGRIKPNDLHKEAITYVAAPRQASVLRHWLDTGLLTEEEERIVARGRNAKSGSVPKNTSVMTYRYSTAFEALIGHHHLLKNGKRLQTLLEESVQFSDERRD